MKADCGHKDKEVIYRIDLDMILCRKCQNKSEYRVFDESEN